ncbi:MAG: hypothetical protein HYR66_18310 [Sphingobacteriales bacterium]|nr:hypothetical protein [Sphingobacteriales bacterium]MBI3718619.1 hypothetical protein [Sphingobacteriales bacterium]
MNRNLSIKLKALFLLVVFASNTAVGFACAVGVDMDFNSPHRSETKESAEVHIHDDGINHQHDSEPAKQIPVGGSNLFTEKDGGCCTNRVQEFQNLNKNVTVNLGISVPVFVAILSIYFDIDLSAAIKDFPVNYKSRFYYPPPPEIRIAIQSFQI